MQNKTKFLYFVIIAPILAKILDWIIQFVQSGNLNFLSNNINAGYDWFIPPLIFQPALMIGLALGIYLIFKLFHADKNNLALALITPLAYLIKGIYNLIVTQIFINTFNTYPVGYTIGMNAINVLIMPIIIFLLLGYIPLKLFFKKK